MQTFKYEQLQKQLKFWEQQNSSYSQGKISMSGAHISWEEYQQMPKKKIVFDIDVKHNELQGNYFQTATEKWVVLKDLNTPLVFPDTKNNFDTISMFQIFLYLFPNSKKQMDIQKQEDGYIYTWNFSSEQVKSMVKKSKKQCPTLLKSELLYLYIQSYLVSQKQLVNQQNIEERLSDNYIDEIIDQLKINGSIQCVTKKNESIYVKLHLKIDKQYIDYEQDTGLYKQELQFLDLQKQKVIPIQEYFLSR
jgi:hypothetical protein